MRKALWMAVLVTASGLLSTTASAQQAKAFTGMRLFNSYCYLCHGTQGKGDGPLAGRLETKPKSLASNEVERLSDREIFRVIQGTAPHGKADQMPEFGRAIPEPDIDALVTYVRFIQKAEHPLMGNPELGKAVYDRYCVVCHGENGRGKGIMTSVLPIHPADHTDAKEMNRMNNTQLINYIARGGTGKSYMPGWEGILTREEMEGVASYIRLLSYR